MSNTSVWTPLPSSSIERIGIFEGSPDEICPQSRFAQSTGSFLEKSYAQMSLVRSFEEKLLSLFEEGKLFGTTHCYIGQEANAIGVINHLEAGDVIFSNHRCHGHFITWSDRPELLMAELMGRATGVVGGRGGSQHICHGGFYTNGIQGGIVPAAAGMAMAEKIKKSGKIAVVFIGDGTLGQGVVYEALNMASLWNLPLLVIVENNFWAQSTPSYKEQSGDLVDRGKAFGIDSGEIRSTDAEELYAHFGPIVKKVRETSRPHFEVIHTYRLCHHSKSDDKRPKDEVERHRSGDPLPKLRKKLSPEIVETIDAHVAARLEAVVQWSEAQPFPESATLRDLLS